MSSRRPWPARRGGCARGSSGPGAGRRRRAATPARARPVPGDGPAGLPVPRRLVLHQRIADALEQRQARGAAVVAADLARHTTAAAPLEGSERADALGPARGARRVRPAWPSREAAGHLARARRAVEDTGAPDAAGVLIDLLIEEADARARTGDPERARTLLDDARGRASRLRGRRAARRGGARRPAARGPVRDAARRRRRRAGDRARRADGSGTALEAHLTASFARELHHSVPAAAAAGPPAVRAGARPRPHARRPATRSRPACSPATTCCGPRGGRRSGSRSPRRSASWPHARATANATPKGLLLTANALLEQGSAAFRSALAEFLDAADGFRQPRHDYLAMTRRGALALIDGRLDEAERLIAEASALGERIGEPDSGQRPDVAALGAGHGPGAIPSASARSRARRSGGGSGVPSHAHAVAAGFLARAGDPDDLDAARRALDTVVALDTWRADRSYLWSVFVGGDDHRGGARWATARCARSCSPSSSRSPTPAG